MFLITFFSPKQSKIKESSIESMAKQLEAHFHEKPKLGSFIILCHKQIMNARRESKERNLTWRIQEDSNFWSTSWSSFHAYYMSFWSSGSQESNTWNGVWIKVEMNKLWPLEANCAKLKGNFAVAKSQCASCEISLWLQNGDLQLAKFHSHLACLRNPPECFQIFATDTFRFFSSDIWCLNPHFLLVIHQS